MLRGGMPLIPEVVNNGTYLADVVPGQGEDVEIDQRTVDECVEHPETHQGRN
jgi:hypothetical protein